MNVLEHLTSLLFNTRISGAEQLAVQKALAFITDLRLASERRGDSTALLVVGYFSETLMREMGLYDKRSAPTPTLEVIADLLADATPVPSAEERPAPQKPAVGIMPKKYWEQQCAIQRVNDLIEAIHRRAEAKQVALPEWSQELGELINQILLRRGISP